MAQQSGTSKHGPLTLLPLGGCGEFGRNCMLLVDGDLQSGPCVLIDVGARMAHGDLPGIDLELPDLDFVSRLGSRLLGYIISHGHEDHIGALPYLLLRQPAPVYATRYCFMQLESRLADFKVPAFPRFQVEPGQRYDVGPFTLEPIAVSHSIPDSLALAIGRGEELILFSGDFRIDLDPVHGPATDVERIRELGQQGVTLLVSDSTGGLEQGDNLGEKSIAPAMAQAVATAQRRVFVTTFPSHVHRLKQILDIAVANGRKVALLGRSAREHFQLAVRAGVIDPPVGAVIPEDRAGEMAPHKLLAIATGCQGEFRAALPRMASGSHELPPIEFGDRIIFSARIIPGNEQAVLKMANNLVRLGADIVWGDKGVHVSGHGCAGDMNTLLKAAQPTLLMPVHGDRMHLEAHAELAKSCGFQGNQIAVAENGQPIELYRESGRWSYRGGAPVEMETILVEQNRELVEKSGVIAARYNASRFGVMSVGVVVQKNHSFGPIDLRTAGFDSKGLEKLLEETRGEIAKSLSKLELPSRASSNLVEENVRTSVRRCFRRRSQRAPQVLVVVLHVEDEGVSQ